MRQQALPCNKQHFHCLAQILKGRVIFAGKGNRNGDLIHISLVKLRSGQIICPLLFTVLYMWSKIAVVYIQSGIATSCQTPVDRQKVVRISLPIHAYNEPNISRHLRPWRNANLDDEVMYLPPLNSNKPCTSKADKITCSPQHNTTPANLILLTHPKRWAVRHIVKSTVYTRIPHCINSTGTIADTAVTAIKDLTDRVANVVPTKPKTPAKIFSMVRWDSLPCIIGANCPPMTTPGTINAMRFHGTTSPPWETIPLICVPAATGVVNTNNSIRIKRGERKEKDVTGVIKP